jgi:Hemerythrin HHE cation binding domain
VWPLLEAVAGERIALVPLTEDHERLDPLLLRAGELADGQRSSVELAAVLREVAELLARHVAAEERDLFPILLERVRVEDYRRLQRRFRGNLRPGLLPFLVPWAVEHATPAERSALLADAGPLRVLYVLFRRRFRVRSRLLFDDVSPRRDRRLMWVMRTASALHVAVKRSSGGRLARRWLGESDLPGPRPPSDRGAPPAARRRGLPAA